MTLQTTRLTLRDLLPTDLHNIHQLLSLPETDEFNTLGIPGSIHTTEKMLLDWCSAQHLQPRVSYTLGIDRLDTKQFIGLIALVIGKEKYRNAEVWYKVHVDHWRNGFTTEAPVKLLNFGFTDLQLHRVEAGCAVENIASFKVLEKVGMQREGIKRKNLPVRGEWKDSYSYAMLKEELTFSTAE